MKPTKIEEQFINLLTRFAWWVDYKYNKGVVWLSVVFTAVTSYTITVLISIDSYNQTIAVHSINFETWVMIFMVIFPSITTIAMLCVLGIFLFILNPPPSHKQLFQNIKKSPNPNKYTYWILSCRLSLVLPFIAGSIQSFGTTSFFGAIFTIVAFTPSVYLFCVDPIPPGLKKKMLEEKETGKLEPVTSL